MSATASIVVPLRSFKFVTSVSASARNASAIFDNAFGDSEATERLLTGAILPVSQYFAYIEVGEEGSGMAPDSSLWSLYERLCSEGQSLSMRRVRSRSEIYPVFHELFQRRRSGEQVVP